MAKYAIEKYDSFKIEQHNSFFIEYSACKAKKWSAHK